LKILKGNPGKRAINMREPKYEEGVPEKPLGLDPYASQKWDEIIRGMKDAKTLTVIDGGIIEAACSSYSQWKRADEYLTKRKSDCYFVKTAAGMKIRRTYPEVSLRTRGKRDYVSYCAELGITTVSRARVKTIPPKSKPDGLASYFESGK
jgi:phage terminase small subunit